MGNDISNLEKYKEMTAKLLELKEDSPERDSLLDEMDSVWWKLSDAEIKQVNNKPNDVCCDCCKNPVGQSHKMSCSYNK